ncbi:unnamed protein product [Amoebophrya sp. A25]|nr:unnamed protein product [Amoebophrya sp. A25]|eukprot:GSA25T00008418001.1
MRSFFGSSVVLLGMSAWTGMQHHVVIAASHAASASSSNHLRRRGGQQPGAEQQEATPTNPMDTSGSTTRTPPVLTRGATNSTGAPEQQRMTEEHELALLPGQQQDEQYMGEPTGDVGTRDEEESQAKTRPSAPFLGKERSKEEKEAGIATYPESFVRACGTEEGTSCNPLCTGVGSFCEGGCVALLAAQEGCRVCCELFGGWLDPSSTAANPKEMPRLGPFCMDQIANWKALYNSAAICRAPHDEMERWKKEKFFGNDVQKMLPFMTSEAIQRRHTCAACAQASCAAETCACAGAQCGTSWLCSTLLGHYISNEITEACGKQLFLVGCCGELVTSCLFSPPCVLALGVTYCRAICCPPHENWATSRLEPEFSMWKEEMPGRPHQIHDGYGSVTATCCDHGLDCLFCKSLSAQKDSISMEDIDKPWIQEHYAALHQRHAADAHHAFRVPGIGENLTLEQLQAVAPEGVSLERLFDLSGGEDHSSMLGDLLTRHLGENAPTCCFILGRPSIEQAKEYQGAAREKMLKDLAERRERTRRGVEEQRARARPEDAAQEQRGAGAPLLALRNGAN